MSNPNAKQRLEWQVGDRLTSSFAEHLVGTVIEVKASYLRVRWDSLDIVSSVSRTHAKRIPTKLDKILA